MNDFCLLRTLGRGSYGSAILAEHNATRRLCVVKRVPLANLTPSEKAEAMREVSVLRRMRHPNIISCWCWWECGGALHIVTDYCDGGDLRTRIQAQKGEHFTQEQILDWFVQVCLAVKHVHDRRVLHRDIKTHNIFLTRAGVAKLGDFGVARPLASTSELAKTCIGTPYYLPPEMCEGRPYNHKADVWALGCVLYEMSTLRHAFEAPNMRQLVLRILRGSLPPVPDVYSPDLRALVSAILVRNPDHRPSVDALLAKQLLLARIWKFANAKQTTGPECPPVKPKCDVITAPSLKYGVSVAQRKAPRKSRRAKECPPVDLSAIELCEKTGLPQLDTRISSVALESDSTPTSSVASFFAKTPASEHAGDVLPAIRSKWSREESVDVLRELPLETTASQMENTAEAQVTVFRRRPRSAPAWGRGATADPKAHEPALTEDKTTEDETHSPGNANHVTNGSEQGCLTYKKPSDACEEICRSDDELPLLDNEMPSGTYVKEKSHCQQIDLPLIANSNEDTIGRNTDDNKNQTYVTANLHFPVLSEIISGHQDTSEELSNQLPNATVLQQKLAQQTTSSFDPQPCKKTQQRNQNSEAQNPTSLLNDTKVINTIVYNAGIESWKVLQDSSDVEENTFAKNETDLRIQPSKMPLCESKVSPKSLSDIIKLTLERVPMTVAENGDSEKTSLELSSLHPEMSSANTLEYYVSKERTLFESFVPSEQKEYSMPKSDIKAISAETTIFKPDFESVLENSKMSTSKSFLEGTILNSDIKPKEASYAKPVCEETTTLKSDVNLMSEETTSFDIKPVPREMSISRPVLEELITFSPEATKEQTFRSDVGVQCDLVCSSSPLMFEYCATPDQIRFRSLPHLTDLRGRRDSESPSCFSVNAMEKLSTWSQEGLFRMDSIKTSFDLSELYADIEQQRANLEKKFGTEEFLKVYRRLALCLEGAGVSTEDPPPADVIGLILRDKIYISGHT